MIFSVHRPPGGISYEKINIARPFRDGFQNFCVPYNRDGTHRAIVVVAKKSSCVWRCVITFTFEKGHIHQLEGGHLRCSLCPPVRAHGSALSASVVS